MATPDKAKKVPVEDLMKELNTSLSGLSSEEAAKRLKQYGYNEIEEKKENPVIRFARKFWGLTPWMLEVTIVLTYVLHKFLDMYIITALLLLNSIISYVQEYKAGNAVEMLKKKLTVNARVLRDGKWQVVPARELVPGDIVRVRLGDFIPADMKIIEGDVSVDQSALTGESLPVEASKNSLLYSGSIIRRGEATAVVVATADKTYFGKTTQLVQVAKPKLHIQEVIMKIVDYLIVMDAIFIAILLAGSLISHYNVLQVLPLALILLVAAIPVALPAMFTIAMALGALQLAKAGVLITRLNAVEDASSMDVVCMDKTGTITENKLTVAGVSPLPSYGKEEVIAYATLASHEATQDPIDIAVINYAKESKIDLSSFKQVSFHPFDPLTKRTEAVVEKDGKQFVVMKGAPQILASLSKMDGEQLHAFEEYVNEASQRGYRVIAVGEGPLEALKGKGKIGVAGLLALYDRPRKDSPALISELKNLGVKPKMLTGDSLPIAKEVAKEVGIGENIIRMSEIENKDTKEKAKIVDEADGFAEIYPEDKYTIVKGLQAAGHTVGMTGDGVNDAPALKQAEVGIAVNNATDVAKGAASAVLTQEGIANIVDMVKIGRQIYQRMITYTMNKIIKAFQIIVFISLAFLIFRQFATTAFDVVLLLFANDFVTMSIATDSVRYSRTPEKWNVGNLVGAAAIIAVAVVAELMGGMYIAHYMRMPLPELQTFVFDLLVFSGQFTVYVVRERRWFWKSRPSKWLLLSSVADIIAISLISVYGILIPPVTVKALAVALIYSMLTTLFLNDAIKEIAFKYYKVQF
ncbi:MAG: plasma-membrane proton-efflux P-type ATPase [Thermoprotei archaeon]